MLSVEAQAVMARVNKAFGEGTMSLASDMVMPKRFTSGCLSLDLMLGGGWPANQWSEIYGTESAGKTAIALKTIAANQKADPSYTALWVAGEHFDTPWAERLGVDTERTLIVPTQNMELALELMLQAADSKAFDAIVLDSYPALIPHEEDEKAMDEVVVAVGAKTFNKYWRKAGKASHRASDGTERPFHGIIINQQRDKIGAWAPRGVPQTSPGGHGKDYAYFVRLQLQRDEYIYEGSGDNKAFVGQSIKMTTVKNKSASPRQTASVDFYFRNAPTMGFRAGEFDAGKDYFNTALSLQIISKSGGWYYFADRKWNGKGSAMTDILAEPVLMEELRAEVLRAFQ